MLEFIKKNKKNEERKVFSVIMNGMTFPKASIRKREQSQENEQ